MKVGKLLEPELHDIGKLIDRRATGLSHNLENYHKQLSTDTWKGIVEHHCSQNFKRYPTSVETFKLCIADSRAASFSRYSVEGEAENVFNVHKLWKPSHDKRSQSFLTSSEDVERLIEFVAKDPSGNEFLSKYKDMLLIRAEDATEGRNITSLYTHCMLVGKFYRLLLDEEVFPLSISEIAGLKKDQVDMLIRRKLNEWKIDVIYFSVNLTLIPVRAKDLNVFKMQEEFLDRLVKKYHDNVFFATDREILILHPKGEEVVNELDELVTEYGFWLDLKRANIQLGSLKPDIRQIPQGRFDSIYPRLEPTITPPICELCQMAQASDEVWMDGESGITERLCGRCMKIRKRGALLQKFTTWEESNMGCSVCWARLTLDYETLLRTLGELYGKYLSELRLRSAEASEIRFPLISEFLLDYHAFLEQLRARMDARFGAENVQPILSGFTCIKLEYERESIGLLRMFYEALSEYFPKFLTLQSPIRLGAFVSNINHPFYEVWSELSKIDREVNIIVQGKGSIRLRPSDIPLLLNARLGGKRALNKLLRINDASTKLAKVILYDKFDRDYKRLEELRQAIEKFGFENVLTYAKLQVE